MNKKLIFSLIGMILIIISVILAIVLYDWKLALIIFLFVTGNNFEQSARRM